MGNDTFLQPVGKNSNSGNALKQYIERIERLESEKQDVADNIKDVYFSAKGEGFDPKIMRQVIRLRKMRPDQRTEYGFLINTYLHAIGEEEFFAGETPLEEEPDEVETESEETQIA